ncbi:hypothetical protein, partial [Brucella abortus]|uniref:hypothetical protein n=1 Tax=Brucella abortus TaxID=235 RepID=UPI001AECBF0B
AGLHPGGSQSCGSVNIPLTEIVHIEWSGYDICLRWIQALSKCRNQTTSRLWLWWIFEFDV